MAISTPMLVTFCVYIFGMILIGFIAWRSTKNFDDYILGGRSLGPFVTALSAGASDMSGWLLMGLPGAVFLSGISESWIAIGLTLGAWINWKLVAGRLRVHTEYNNNALTLPDYFTGRFEDKSRILRIISALVILLFFTIYCASGIVAGARLFESTFGMSYETALWAGAAATILYTFIGGFLAVSWTDTVQASLMIFALILTPVIVIISVGGFGDSLEVIKQKSIENVDMLKGLNFVAIVSLMGWGLGYFGMPQVLVRFLSIRSSEEIKKSRIIATTWCVVSLACGVCIGLVGRAMMPTQFATQAAAENIFIVVSQALLPSFMCGIVVSGIFAASMSSSSSYMIIGASAVGENIFRGLLHRKATDRQVMMVARITLLVMFIFGIVVAFDQNSSIFQVVSYAWAGLGASFGPLMLTSLYWRRTNKYGAIAGMLSGTATVLIWHNLVKPLGGIFAIYELLPAFIVSLLFIVVISLLTPAPSAEVLHEFDHYLDDPDDRHVDDDLVAAEIAAGEKRSQI